MARACQPLSGGVIVAARIRPSPSPSYHILSCLSPARTDLVHLAVAHLKVDVGEPALLIRVPFHPALKDLTRTSSVGQLLLHVRVLEPKGHYVRDQTAIAANGGCRDNRGHNSHCAREAADLPELIDTWQYGDGAVQDVAGVVNLTVGHLNLSVLEPD